MQPPIILQIMINMFSKHKRKLTNLPSYCKNTVKNENIEKKSKNRDFTSYYLQFNHCLEIINILDGK